MSLTEFLICIIAVFVLTVGCAIFLIPILRAHKIGQHINEAGPVWHAVKNGTPTMGGICFIVPLLLTIAGVLLKDVFFAEISPESAIPLAMTVFLAFGCGAVGFIDDYKKLIKKQNEGLTSPQKMLLLLLVGSVYLIVMGTQGYLDTIISIPYFGVEIDLGILYWVLALLCLAGMTNSTNITDGIDGLASSVSLTVAVFLAAAAFLLQNRELGLIGGCLIGGMFGFLIFNFHPAKVIMGDTGSLFLGGLIMGAGLMIDQPIVILIASLMFILEAVSSAIQIFSIRVFHKKAFPMAPIHHTLEMHGWSEVKIVSVFSIVSLIFCAVAWFGL